MAPLGLASECGVCPVTRGYGPRNQVGSLVTALTRVRRTRGPKGPTGTADPLRASFARWSPPHSTAYHLQVTRFSGPPLQRSRRCYLHGVNPRVLPSPHGAWASSWSGDASPFQSRSSSFNVKPLSKDVWPPETCPRWTPSDKTVGLWFVGSLITALIRVLPVTGGFPPGYCHPLTGGHTTVDPNILTPNVRLRRGTPSRMTSKERGTQQGGKGGKSRWHWWRDHQ